MAQHYSQSFCSEASDIGRLRTNGVAALAEQFVAQRSHLRRIVRGAVGKQLRRRLDASDVVQEVYIEASRSLSQFLRNPVFSARNWLIALTTQRVRQTLRRHFLRKCRSLNVEVSMDAGTHSDFCSAAEISDARPSPAGRAMRIESSGIVQKALRSLSPSDQEILQLRTIEGKGNVDAADVLDITPAAATKRYVRALERLNMALQVNGWTRE